MSVTILHPEPATVKTTVRRVRCPDCDGVGIVAGWQDEGYGAFYDSHDCYTCDGTGTLTVRVVDRRAQEVQR